MKKFVVIALLMVMVTSMFGCGNKAQEEKTEVAESGPTLSEIAPDPKALFDQAVFEVTDPEDGDVYQFILKNGTRDMFETYVNACKDGIFTEANCDLENNYQAYTADKLHWISVSYFPGTETDPNNTYVYVDVRNARD